MESCPTFLNRIAAKEAGFEDQLVSPLLVLSTALSLGVQNDSEKAIAHLGYYDVCFPKAAIIGDTLRAATRVVSVHTKPSVRGAHTTGIVLVESIGLNQQGEVLVRYLRKIMIPSRGSKRSQPYTPNAAPFPWPFQVSITLPSESLATSKTSFLPKSGPFFEDFSEGEVIAHSNGRTVTDEHIPWTYRIGNTHPLHFDRIYANRLSPPMGGEPVVFGAFVFSWIAGLASRDITENQVWDLGYTEGYHTQPVRSGDTLYAVSRVLKKEEQAGIEGAGILQLQLIGLKNIAATEAISKFGDALFVKENDKKKSGERKILEKVFEIQRRVLIKKRQ
jgi:2-methylfumaryl-CoA hydratase